MTAPTTHVRETVVERAQGRCERCGGPGMQVHHRQPRKAGGSRRAHINAPSNLVLLCLDCHTLIESRRTYAYASGWLVREPKLPGCVPVMVVGLGWVFLDDEGGYQPVEASA